MAEEEKKEKLGFFGEFKKFISKGNIVDMAVGIIIGSSFTAIVNSLVNDVLMPLIGLLKEGGFADMYVGIFAEGFAEADTTLANGAVIKEGEQLYRTYIYYGNFIQAIVNFLLIAFTLFIMVKIFNRIRDHAEDTTKKLKKQREERLKKQKNKDKTNEETENKEETSDVENKEEKQEENKEE